MVPQGRPIRHPLLASCGVAHGFGLRGLPEPSGFLRPRQVHGAAVARVGVTGRLAPVEADAVVSTRVGSVVGVLTADCVPILVAAPGGGAVAAVHAGWRGLASGVVAAGVEALAAEAACGGDLVAVIGPRIGRCCYEVDRRVVTALAARFGSDLEPAVRPSRPGHSLLDLAALARCELLRVGLNRRRIAVLSEACTCCDASRFYSYRRDGERAGRLVHYIAVAGTSVAFSEV